MIVFGVVTQVNNQVKLDMEDNTIQLGEFLLVEDLSKDGALIHFYFYKMHL